MNGPRLLVRRRVGIVPAAPAAHAGEAVLCR
jgi:hypothetical protein